MQSQQPEPSTKVSWPFALWAALTLGTAGGALWSSWSPGAMDLAQTVLWLLALLVLGRDFALTAGRSVRTPDTLELQGKRGSVLWRTVQVVFLLAALAGPPILLVVWLADVGILPCDDTLKPNASVLGVAINGLQLVGYAVLSRAWEDADWSLFRRLLRAEAYRGGRVPAGTLLRAVGTVRDRTPIEGPTGAAAFAVVSETEHLPGSDPNIVTSRLLNDATFQLETPYGTLELQPTMAFLKSPAQDERHGHAPSGNRLTQTAQYLPLGARILVVGRVQGTLEGAPLLAGTADEPLLLFPFTEGQDEQSFALAALAAHRANTVLLVCLALAAVGLGVAGAQHFPPYHFPSSSGD